jgi:hypothetical protein
MNKRSLVTAGCLVAALGFYAVGYSSISACLLLGIAFEAVFWVRILRRKQP